MPLLVHFHRVHGELQSSLADLQTKLNAVDVPVGSNMESIRSELRDAQVDLKLLSLLRVAQKNSQCGFV